MDLALAQLRVEPGATAANLDRAVDAVERAAARGADLVVLPEQFHVGFFAFDAYDAAAEPLDGPTLRRLAAAAVDNGVALLAGSVVEDLAASRERGHAVPAETGLSNTAVLFDADGERLLAYRKHNLFGFESREADLLVPGEGLPTAALGGFTVGVSTCYDLRFPGLYADLLDAGATLVLVPSAWPYPRVEHWHVLPRARSVENACYVAAANGVGDQGASRLCGRSAVYDPWGTPVASAGDDPKLLQARADPDAVTAVRESFPAVRDRRRR